MRERVTVPREEQAKFMRAAITEAKKAALLNEVPIGAVVTYQGKIIGRGHNMREKFQDVTYHVTLEPCMMCSGAIVNARIRNVFYGATDPKAGTVDSLYHLLGDERLNHQVYVTAGVLGEQCSQMLKDFFRTVRKKRKLARKKKKTSNSKQNVV